MVRSTIVLLAVAVSGHSALSAERIAGPVAADLVRVRDGDSVDVIAKVWPQHRIHVSIRLRGVDAPELSGQCVEEKRRARSAKTRVSQLLQSRKIRLYDISGSKYFGRILARVETQEGIDIGKTLLLEKLARSYRGGKRGGWCGPDALAFKK